MTNDKDNEKKMETIQRLERRMSELYGLLMHTDEILEDIRNTGKVSFIAIGVLVGMVITLLFR